MSMATNQPIVCQRPICGLGDDACIECASVCFELVEVTPVAVLDRIEEMWEADLESGNPGYVGCVRKLWMARITATGTLCWVSEYTDADGVYERFVYRGHEVSEAWDNHRPGPYPVPTRVDGEDIPF